MTKLATPSYPSSDAISYNSDNESGKVKMDNSKSMAITKRFILLYFVKWKLKKMIKIATINKMNSIILLPPYTNKFSNKNNLKSLIT